MPIQNLTRSQSSSQRPALYSVQLSSSRGKKLRGAALEAREWRSLRGKHGLSWCWDKVGEDSTSAQQPGNTQGSAPPSTSGSSYTGEPREPLESCRRAWESTQGCTWSTHSSWRGAEGVIKGQRSVSPQKSPSPTGMEGLVSGILIWEPS